MDEVNINVAVGGGNNAGDGKQKNSKCHHFYRSPEERRKMGKDMYIKFMNGETIHELSEEYGYSSCASTNSAITNIMREYVYSLSSDEQYLFEKRRSHYGRTHREEIAKEFRIMHPEASEEAVCSIKVSDNEFDGYIDIKDVISDIRSACEFLYTIDEGGNNFYIAGSSDEVNSLFRKELEKHIEDKTSCSIRVMKMKITDDKLYSKVIQEATLNYK